MRHKVNPLDPYAIVSGRDMPTSALARNKGKRYCTLPRPEHNPYGGTVCYHSTLTEARERNSWARIVRGWEDSAPEPC